MADRTHNYWAGVQSDECEGAPLKASQGRHAEPGGQAWVEGCKCVRVQTGGAARSTNRRRAQSKARGRLCAWSGHSHPCTPETVTSDQAVTLVRC